jgi:TRAP-type C4-dicarboxylate transport system permease small subunit
MRPHPTISVQDTVLAIAMAVMVVVATMQVAARYVFDHPLAWSEEAVRYLMIWTAFLAAAWSVRDQEHIVVEVVLPFLPPRLQRVVLVLRHLLVAFFCVVLLPSAVRLTIEMHAQLGVAIEIPLSLVFASLPVGLVLMAAYALRLTLVTWRGTWSQGPVTRA